MTDANILVRDEVRRILPYNAGLTVADVQARYAPTRISKLASNENPLGPTPAVNRALTASLQAVHLYPDPAGRALREELAVRHNVRPSQIILGNGSEDLLAVICRTTLRPGDRLVTLFPSFPLHEDHATVMGAVIERIGIRDDFSIDVDALVAATSSAPRMVMFANPMNPAGCWLLPEELSRVIAALTAETLLVVDEAYAEYAAGPDYPAAPEMLRHSQRNWIVLRTFSKAWGLAGLRIGYGIVGNPELAAFFDRIRTPFNTNGLAQVAALAALGDTEHVARVVGLALTERHRVRTELVSRHYRVAPSKANFLFFDTGSDASVVSERLLQHGVIVKPWKQDGYRNFIRVSIGSPEENDHFLEALAVTRL